MNSREEIFETLQQILTEMFEIKADDITLAASLNQDLDIDSIDAVDLMVRLREMTGRRIQPEEFRNVRVIQDVVEVLYRMQVELPL
jgi:acyl carrier protein